MREPEHMNGVNHAAFLFAAAPTYEEYLAGDLAPARLLRARMAEIRVSPGDQAFFSNLPEPVYLVAVAPGDSPSTVAVLPIMVRIARTSSRIDLRVLQEDDGIELLRKLIDDPELLDSLPQLDLPLLVVFDRERRYLGHWGPHPQGLHPYLDEWLSRYPNFETLSEDDTAQGEATYASLTEQLTHELRLWFNSGLNQACVAEIRSLFPSPQDDSGHGPDAAALAGLDHSRAGGGSDADDDNGDEGYSN